MGLVGLSLAVSPFSLSDLDALAFRDISSTLFGLTRHRPALEERGGTTAYGLSIRGALDSRADSYPTGAHVPCRAFKHHNNPRPSLVLGSTIIVVHYSSPTAAHRFDDNTTVACVRYNPLPA